MTARAVSYLLVFVVVISAQIDPLPAWAQGGIEAIRAHWKAGEYDEVIRKAVTVRQEPFGRTLELDYMIGTSLCRTQTLEESGLRFLKWCLCRYNMPVQDKETILAEVESCTVALMAPPATLNSSAFTASAGTGSGVSGKMYHFVPNEEAIGTTTIKIVNPKSLDELRSRLFSPADSARAVRAVAGRLGPKFTVKSMGKFVIASSNPSTDFKEMARRLGIYEEFFRTEYGLELPPYLITVYVVPNIDRYRHLALELHGFEMPEASIGYSFRDDLSLVVYCRERWTGTLYHELFHLMARSTFGDIPPWLDEGMAALYEVSEIRGPQAAGIPNWRGRILREQWNRRPPLEQLVLMDWETFDGSDNPDGHEDFGRQAVNHATARHLALYLQEKGQLSEVFNSFRMRQPEDVLMSPEADAVGFLEHIVGVPIAELDSTFAVWFKSVE